MIKTTHGLWAGVALAAALAAGIAIWRLWPVVFPQAAVAAALDPQCDLRAGPCTSSLGEGGRITFAIEPSAIALLKPLHLQVRVEGLAAQAVRVDFSGVDMNMGFNRPLLQAAGPGVFEGRGTLPVCVRDAMQWEARVMVQTPQGLAAAPYRFWTYKPGEGPQ